MKKFLGAILTLVLVGFVFTTSCLAWEHERGTLGGPDRLFIALGPEGPIREDFRYPPDEARWCTGHWVKGWRTYRLGWWWVVDPFWYPYSKPVYPYPPYPNISPPHSVPVPTFFYYCDNPHGYFPSIPTCRGGWYLVPSKSQQPPKKFYY